LQVTELLVDPSAADPGLAGSGAHDLSRPLGFVDLDTCPHDTRLGALPPFPLIGLGDPAHPLAGVLDALVEGPVSAEALVRQTLRAPRAAAVVVQLLRSLEGLPVDRALRLESMCYGLLQGSAEHQEWLAARVVAVREPVPARAGPPAVASAPERMPAATPDAAPAGALEIERHGSTLQLVINRPWAHNAIDCSLRDQLFEAFTIATLDSEVRSINLRSVGPTFSVGADLDEFGTTRDPATAHLIRSRTLPALAIARHTGILDVHVQGACVGSGLEMAAFAGRVTASARAWFQLPELAMGLIPGAGGCVSVPRRIGRQRAALMILSGRRISAPTALRWGLIDAIQELEPV
jgi:enoyl-CoA hydratase/carnithine racemase